MACAITRIGWRLTPLLLLCLLLAGIGAMAADHLPSHALSSTASPAWLDRHIALSIMTYGLLTIAAVASLAVFVQEAAFRRRHLAQLGNRLPAIAESERILIALLIADFIVLGFGLITGVINQEQVSGHLLAFNHKTVLAFQGFAEILAFLIMFLRSGRRAAQLVLVAYLLVTLAYPGVKFVRHVLLS